MFMEELSPMRMWEITDKKSFKQQQHVYTYVDQICFSIPGFSMILLVLNQKNQKRM